MRVPARRWLLCWLSLFLTTHAFSEPLTLLSEPFDTLDVPRIRAIFFDERNNEVSRAMAALFLSDAETLAHHPHAKREWLDPVMKRCTPWEASGYVDIAAGDRARAAYVCAFAEAELIDALPIWDYFSLAHRIERNEKLAHGSPLDFAEVLYAKGRLAASLPKGFGQNFARALVAFQTLKRLRPDLHQVSDWLFQTYAWQGNRPAAEAALRAAKRNALDGRARLITYFDSNFAAQRYVDGESFGISPGVALSPVQGLELDLSYEDSRLFDKDRSLRAETFVSTLGSYGLSADYSDRALYPDVTLDVRASGAKQREEFYGLGIDSAASLKSELHAADFLGQFTATREFLKVFFFGVGYRALGRGIDSVEGNFYPSLSLPGQYQAFLAGALFHAGFDTRDSRENPRRGVYFATEGFFADPMLGSSYSFSKWSVQAEGDLPLDLHQGVRATLGFSRVSPQAPLAAYPRLAGDFYVPGVREDRYWDRAIAVGVLEYRHHLFGAFTGGAFATAGSAASDAGPLFQSTIKGGGGITLEISPNRSNRRSLRIDAGFFGGEFTIQGKIGIGVG